MIHFRYHIVSLAAVFLALGVGIVLGSGPLDEQLQGTLATQTHELRGDQKSLREKVAGLQQQVGVDEKFATEVTDPMTSGLLAHRRVVIFGLPDADKTAVDDTAQALERAGATVTARVDVTDVYVDPAKAKAPLEDLALRLVPPGVEFADGATAIERVGTVLARATVARARRDTRGVDQRAAEVLAGLQELGAIEVTGEPGRRAQLAVVVAPPPAEGKAPDADARTGADAALLGLTKALHDGSRGVVITGPTKSAAAGGFLATVRKSDDEARGVSTVDVAGATVGRIALVLALVEQTRGAAGDYGAGHDVDSVVPDISR